MGGKVDKLIERLAVKPGKRIRLKNIDASDTSGLKDKEEAAELLAKNTTRMGELQHLLYAENTRSLLIIFQAMDSGGKDGTIRHVMTGVNPQGCRVVSFKAPSAEELDYGFLWRIHRAIPPKGEIGIFNRSHYEDVLVVRVHNIVPKKIWQARYEQINAFEKLLCDSGMVIIKFFLHISKDEQKQRLQERLDDPSKHWKFDPSDLSEREHWDDYMEAYEDVFEKCNTKCAPWYIIPANKKWFRNLAVSQIIVETLESLDMQYPEPKNGVASLKVD
ncbi:MAG TPA: polyphosphate kinase 2 family protein [Candidatus Brocadiia bacterium]|nr:polyphosphate kinase 2 family protein [Candidatus Brocadiia bacterium]